MDKSLEDWRLELKDNKKVWAEYYESMLGLAPSNYMRLYRAVKLYGTWPVFEAILDSSTRELTGDKLNYVLKVAHEKWKSEQQTKDSNDEYNAAIERAKETTLAKNASLAARAEGRKPKRKYTRRVDIG